MKTTLSRYRHFNRLTIICALIAATLPASARPMQVPATRIALDVPEGYEVAKQFPGFINENTGASIVSVEMPAAAFADFQKADFAAKLATNGFANVKPGKLPFPGNHIYVTAEQATAAGAFAKFLMIFADAKTTAMLTVNVLKADMASGKTKQADIEKMLATAHLTTDAAAALPSTFTLSYLGPFKAAGALGPAQLYTRDGKLAPDKPDPGRAVFVVAPSLAKSAIADLPGTSKAALISMFDLDAGTIKSQGAVIVDGLEGYEIELEAPRRSAAPKALAYQLILRAKDGGYMRLIGTADALDQDAPTLMAEFRKMAASFKAAAPQ